eukprot:1874359-Pleurochrysis_carterae.AAC.6
MYCLQAPTLWIEGEQKRYIPVKGDQILGVVLDKNAEDYKLDIGAAAQARFTFSAHISCNQILTAYVCVFRHPCPSWHSMGLLRGIGRISR